MTFLSARRAMVMVASAATLAALSLPGVASAAPKTDLGEQCSGTPIEGLGSTFQAPIDYVWTGYNWAKSEVLSSGFNVNTNTLACQGTAGTKKTTGTPTVRWNQNEAEKGSGACLKDFGASGAEVRTAKFPICGTDEAPSVPKKQEMETHGSGQESESIETIPVLQGALAIIVHLPEGCVAASEPKVKGAVKKIGRLSLSQSVIDSIYRGTVTKWSQITENKDAVTPFAKKITVETVKGSPIIHVASGGFPEVVVGMKVTGSGIPAGTTVLSISGEELTLSENATKTTEKVALTFTASCNAEATITPVVRLDKSGTTHIFKVFLAQVNPASFQAEAFSEVNGEFPCAKHPSPKTETERTEDEAEAKGPETKTWAQVGEGCENQRWPEAAHVKRGLITGNPGVIKRVNELESSIGYADLAAAAELEYFDNPAEGGGEVKAGEKHAKFWAYVQDNPNQTEPEYAEPGTAGDKTTKGSSNCASTVYAAREGEGFPPASTRSDWSPVKGEKESKTYSICGLTYMLAYRAYGYYLPQRLPGATMAEKEEESKKIATTSENFLKFAVSSTAGGKEAATAEDYDALPTEVRKIAEAGIVEIGNKKA